LIERAIRIEVGTDGQTSVPAIDYAFAGPTLDEKKAALWARVRRLEAEALEKAMPAAKARHFQFREADIRKADQARYAAEMAKGPTAPIDFEHFSLDNRPLLDTRFLEEQAARQDQANEINRWAAKLDHDIDDLTEETFDAFKTEPLVING
jgi:hypothetical protein